MHKFNLLDIYNHTIVIRHALQMEYCRDIYNAFDVHNVIFLLI